MASDGRFGLSCCFDMTLQAFHCVHLFHCIYPVRWILSQFYHNGVERIESLSAAIPLPHLSALSSTIVLYFDHQPYDNNGMNKPSIHQCVY